MKKLVLGALCVVLGFAANAAVTKRQINGLYYFLDDSTMTAEVVGDLSYMMDLKGNVEIPASVTDGDKFYAVTSIGVSAFNGCTALKSVSAPSVTSIGVGAFGVCRSLTSVYAPSVTSIEKGAFGNCDSLTSLTVNSAMKEGWDAKKGDYGLEEPAPGFTVTFYTPTVKVEPNPAANSTAKVYTNGVEVTSNPVVVLSNATVAVVFTTEDNYCFADDHSTSWTNTVQASDNPTLVPGPDVVKIPLMPEEVAQQAGYEVKEAEFETTVSVTVVADPSVTLKSNGQEISEEDYAKACEFYGIEQKTKPDVPSTPTAEDFKVVSKDAQVVQEGEVAVTKESIAAAKAEIVNVANGMVYLGVSVLSNSDITASTAWAPVKFPENPLVYITEDGTKLILPIPASAKQGFMILRSGDAKVSEGGVRVPVTGKPWYTPTVED